jgi:hypothetical protein
VRHSHVVGFVLFWILAFSGCASKEHSSCYKQAMEFCAEQPHVLAEMLGSNLTAEEKKELEKDLYKSCLKMADELDQRCLEDDHIVYTGRK